jgi:hypothetical protein
VLQAPALVGLLKSFLIGSTMVGGIDLINELMVSLGLNFVSFFSTTRYLLSLWGDLKKKLKMLSN